jgi:hypothetical protein
VDDLREFLDARLGGSWLALPEEVWSEWWRGVSREEDSKRYRQIQAESDLVRDEWFATREGRSAFAPGGYPQWGNLYSLVFARKFSALFSLHNKTRAKYSSSNVAQRVGRLIATISFSSKSSGKTWSKKPYR